MKTDLRALKEKNPIAEVIKAAGVALVFDEKVNLWRGVDDPALEVDPAKGRYRQGSESGDVFAWLMTRFSWSFTQARRYLENCAALPVIQTTTQSKTTDKTPSSIKTTTEAVELRQEGRLDRRVRDALQAGRDYPGGGFERFLGLHYVAMILESSWMPGEFNPSVGYLLDGDTCDQCGQDLSGWQALGRAFRAVELRPDGSMTTDGQIYCAKCVEKFKRWRGGLHLLAMWKAANPDPEDQAAEFVFSPRQADTLEVE